MSMELMVKAMKAKVGNPLRKLVLLKLADNANDHGECWPSYAYIAEQCEITRRSVMQHVKKLEEAGFLMREYRKGEKGNSSNVFHLNFDIKPDLPSEYHSPASERNSLPPSESGSPSSESNSPPLVNLVHPEPVTLEPVNESLKDLCPKSSFKKFFMLYPNHRKGGSDSSAWKAWKSENLTVQDCEAAINWLLQAAERDPSWGVTANGQYILGVTKFIREKTWLTPLPVNNSPHKSLQIPIYNEQVNEYSDYADDFCMEIL
ncbi:helix-turn-helix domain-containing protein [Shewanella subflava]|uniref:Helix-turn-helix domain-containing protein n=1 Tax=Shewanella subflava TaxID=2986476 RepID=A0ABT3I5Q9_9GAMM|nr:helix-turn-helix domain-containing protein [Shewanella subflava]MCW3171409.1 helix-turn-helix domain-containing protein [Shewanella subflava]